MMSIIFARLPALALIAASAWSQLRIPNRPKVPLFTGEQGKQRTEIRYDRATRTVTMRLLVQDPHGYFIPGIRPENFAVYENGVLQNNISVNVEHPPVSVALLLEYGGRHVALNRDLALEISHASQQILDALGNEDAAAIWTYADQVNQLAAFTQNRQDLASVVGSLGLTVPGVSETNLYDAVIFAFRHIRPISGRKAIIACSTGIDTFSKATLDDAVNAARQSDTPFYAISLAPAIQQAALLEGLSGLKIEWNAGEKALGEIARASGGRRYSPPSTADLAPVVDDLTENLKLRYVIQYQSSNGGDPDAPRTVRVALREAGTGKPLRIVDAAGRQIDASVIAETSYTPAVAMAKAAP
jgi:VWFA-related protein